jgi:hypothetical protein
MNQTSRKQLAEKLQRIYGAAQTRLAAWKGRS